MISRPAMVVPEGGFGLGVDEVVDVFYGEGGFGGVGDLPDDDGADVDGVAVEVVDFDGVGFKVADFDADFGGVAEWGDGSESGVADGADVASEELDDSGFAGADDAYAGEPEKAEDEAAGAGQYERNTQGDADGACVEFGGGGADEENRGGDEDDADEDDDGGESASPGPGFAFGDVDSGAAVANRGGGDVWCGH